MAEKISEQILAKDQLNLRDLQSFHQALDREKYFDQDVFRNIAYLSVEVGELVNAVRKLRKVEKGVEEISARNHVGDELADCLAYIVKLANYNEINLQDAYLSKMKRNTKREWHKVIR